MLKFSDWIGGGVMRDKTMERWSTYEPYYVELGDKKVADIVVTNHARRRWIDRVESNRTGFEDIAAFLWEKLKAGLESIKDFDAQGLIPPVTITAKDHQGGGKGRISQWDGSKWVPKTDWYAASQDLVWELVRKNAEEFKTSGK